MVGKACCHTTKSLMANEHNASDLQKWWRHEIAVKSDLPHSIKLLDGTSMLDSVGRLL